MVSSCLLAFVWVLSSLSLSDGYSLNSRQSYNRPAPPTARLDDKRSHHPNKDCSSFQQQVSVWAATAVLAATVLVTFPLPTLASSYYSFTNEQKVVAEAWRLVDNSFLDRTFNGQDWFELRQTYVKQAKSYESMDQAYEAIEQMVETLGDSYTRYLSPSKYASLVNSATGSFAGLGVELGTDSVSGLPMATDVEDKSPAKAAGIQAGYRFVEVDGTIFEPNKSTPDDVAIKLRGPKGSRVGVVLLDPAGQKVDVILTRAPITITAVRSYVSTVPGVSGKVGVIRIKNFSSTTAATVAEQLAALKAKGASSFVIDLRGNPGGLLPGGVETASLFLQENKPVVYVVSKTGIVDSQQSLTNGVDLESTLVVLVDSNTASAAEVFTAALQENGRATVAGGKTFGKGIVQTVRELSDNNGGLAITVARYETPKHNDINKRGIPVDVATPVSCAKDDATACLTASVFQKPVEI